MATEKEKQQALQSKLQNFDFETGNGSYEDYTYLADHIGEIYAAYGSKANDAHDSSYRVLRQLLHISLTGMNVPESEYADETGFDTKKAVSLFREKWNKQQGEPRLLQNGTFNPTVLRALVQNVMTQEKTLAEGELYVIGQKLNPPKEKTGQVDNADPKKSKPSEADRDPFLKPEANTPVNVITVQGTQVDVKNLKTKPVTAQPEKERPEVTKPATGLTVPQSTADYGPEYTRNIQRALYAAGYYNKDRAKGKEGGEIGTVVPGKWNEVDTTAFAAYLKDKHNQTFDLEKGASLEQHQLVVGSLLGQETSVSKTAPKPKVKDDDDSDVVLKPKKPTDIKQPITPETTVAAKTDSSATLQNTVRERLNKMSKEELITLMETSIMALQNPEAAVAQAQTGPMADFFATVNRFVESQNPDFRTPTFAGTSRTREPVVTEAMLRSQADQAATSIFTRFAEKDGGGGFNPVGMLGSAVGSMIGVRGGSRNRDSERTSDLSLDRGRVEALLARVYPDRSIAEIQAEARQLLGTKERIGFDEDVSLGKEGKRLELDEFKNLVRSKVQAGDPDWIAFLNANSNTAIQTRNPNTVENLFVPKNADYTDIDNRITRENSPQSRRNSVVDEFRRETDGLIATLPDGQTVSRVPDTRGTGTRQRIVEEPVVLIPIDKTTSVKTAETPKTPETKSETPKAPVVNAPEPVTAARATLKERDGYPENESTKAAVTGLQRALIMSGFLSHRTGDDGLFGTRTGNAVGAANLVFNKTTVETASPELLDTLNRYVLGQKVNVNGAEVQLTADERKRFIEAYAETKGANKASVMREMNTHLEELKKKYAETPATPEMLERNKEKEALQGAGVEQIRKDLIATGYLGKAYDTPSFLKSPLSDAKGDPTRVALDKFREDFNANLPAGAEHLKGVISNKDLSELSAKREEVQKASQETVKTAQVLQQVTAPAPVEETRVRLEDIPSGELLSVIGNTIKKNDRDGNGALDQRELSDALGIGLSDAEKLTKDLSLGKHIGERDLRKLVTDDSIRDRISPDSLSKIEQLVADANVSLKGVKADSDDLAMLTDKEIQQTPFKSRPANGKTTGGMTT